MKNATILLVLAGFMCGCGPGGPVANNKQGDNNSSLDCSERMFSEPVLQTIEATSFAACGNDGSQTLRFVMLADDNSAVRPETRLGCDAAFDPAQIDFIDSALMAGPDSECGGTDDCSLDTMMCGVAPGLASGTEPRCHNEVELNADGPARFESNTDRDQLFGVVMENSGSLEGWVPADVGALYPDWDNDGTAEGAADVGILLGRAADPNKRRSAALTIMTANFQNVAENTRTEERTTQYGLWEFSGTSATGVVALTQALNDDSSWVTQPSNITEARARFSDIGPDRGNVFMAILHVLDTAYALPEHAEHEKTMVVFVDGHDELRLPAFSADAVIERATELDVRIFIVHLDAAQEMTTQVGTPVHRDDPGYWDRQVNGQPIQSPCTDDTDCKNFERCRVPTGYASSPNAPVEIAPDGSSYCMPTRDSDGRLGPIQEYERITCATGGGYNYVKSAAGLRPRMDWLPYTIDGLWSVETAFDSSPMLGETYRLQTTMSTSIGSETATYRFAQDGEPTLADDGADTRSPLFY